MIQWPESGTMPSFTSSPAARMTVAVIGPNDFSPPSERISKRRLGIGRVFEPAWRSSVRLPRERLLPPPLRSHPGPCQCRSNLRLKLPIRARNRQRSRARAPGACPGPSARRRRSALPRTDSEKPLEQGIDVTREAVTGTALGDDQRRVGDVGLQLQPEPAHLHVDGPIVDLCLMQT